MIVEEHEQTPGIEKELREALQLERSVGSDCITCGMLHEGVGGENEIAGEPAAQGDAEGREEMVSWSEFFFAPDHGADQSAFEKESEHSLHGEGLADDVAGEPGEGRPVGSELEFHGDPGNDADGEIDPKDVSPEACGISEKLIASAQMTPFEINDDPGQTHRELWEEIVVSNGEGELEAAPE